MILWPTARAYLFLIISCQFSDDHRDSLRTDINPSDPSLLYLSLPLSFCPSLSMWQCSCSWESSWSYMSHHSYFDFNIQQKEQRLLTLKSGTRGTALHVRMRRRRGRCHSEATPSKRKSQTSRKAFNEISSAYRKQSETWVHCGIFFSSFSSLAQICTCSIFDYSTYVTSTLTNTFRFTIIPNRFAGKSWASMWSS